MFFEETVPFIRNFIEEMNLTLVGADTNNGLSRAQRYFLGVCLMGILLTNSISWSKFMRASLGLNKVGALSWMFRHSKVFWEKLLLAGITVVMRRYKLTNGILIIDDTDRQRSKNTTRIFNVHKIFDKKTSGYFNGQSIAFILLVTEKVTIPVGFRFYYPDLELTKWKKEDEKLKAEGVRKEHRPVRPERNPTYPSKTDIGLDLIKDFKENFPSFAVNGIIADAFYGSLHFFDNAKKVYPKVQVISQLRCNQLVRYKGKMISVEDFFKQQVLVEHKISIRGEDAVTVWMHGARLVVDAHRKKRYVIALRYDGEEESRYILASNLGWRMQDVVETYSLRWLVEVFFQDWKGNEGWGELELQYIEGSKRAAILSLLFDYSLLLHPSQFRVVERKLPAYTVGSLIEQSRVEVFLQFVKNIIESEDREKYFSNFEASAKELFKLRPSKKHMSGRTLSRMSPTKQLQDKWEEAEAA